MNYTIETIDLSKRFPCRSGWFDYLPGQHRKWALGLDKVNIRVKAGEIFGLVGPNGGGKTTLLKILCTLLLPSDGKAYIDGHDVESRPVEVRKSIGCTFETGRAFYYRLTGRQNLSFFTALNNLSGVRAGSRIEEVLHLVGISDDADRPFMDYSTGLRQKLGLARALLNDPQILLLDEPTKSLDPLAAHNFRKFLKEELVRRRGKTIFIVTHGLEETEYLCDQIAFLDRGTLIETGNFVQISKYLRFDHEMV